MRGTLPRRLAAAVPPARDLSDTSPGPPATARPFMLMFAAGAVLALVHVAIPGADHSRDGVMLGVAAGAFSIAALIYAGWRRIPSWAYQLFLAAASLLTALAMYGTAETTSVYATFFFWITICAFYFFNENEAAEQSVIIAIAAALGASADPGNLTSVPVINWMVTMAVLIVAGALIGRMGRQRMSSLADRVEEAARTDQMTGLLNRRGFQDALKAEFERSQRTNRSFSVLVADLDAFRRINEGFGPHAGDLAFEYVGAIIRRAKRRIDVAGRIGEDEFALLLPETTEHAAFMVAERIRHELKASFASEPVPLTISIGVVNWPLHQSTARGMITAGEHALMLAKELGGDCSAMYGDNILTRLATASARKDEDKHLATLVSLAEAVDIRDGGTAEHCQNVGRYAAAIARELNLPSDIVDRVRSGGIVHDLGKVGVPDSILGKPGPLTDDEWTEMRKHPELGAHILEGPDLADLRVWVLSHHERPDGRGYPFGLGPDQVPLEAKIIAVADAFEAMTADRVYRPGLSVDEACRRLRAGAGTQFDRRAVDAMLKLVERRDLMVTGSLRDARDGYPLGLTREEVAEGGQWLSAPATRTMGGPSRTISARGRLAGRWVEAVWSDGRVSGDPLVVTMVDQLVTQHRLDLEDPWNFLLLMGAAVEQGSLDAEGDLPDSSLVPVPA